MLGQTTHDVATVASRQGAEVTIVYRRPLDKMPATKMEIEHVMQEGVQILHLARTGRRGARQRQTTPRRCASPRSIGPAAR